MPDMDEQINSLRPSNLQHVYCTEPAEGVVAPRLLRKEAPTSSDMTHPFLTRVMCGVVTGVTLDIQFEVSVVAGPAASWGVSIVERFHTGTAAGGRHEGGDLSMIPCGKPFTLEIEAIDVNHNRFANNQSCMLLGQFCVLLHPLTDVCWVLWAHARSQSLRIIHARVLVPRASWLVCTRCIMILVPFSFGHVFG